VEEDRRGAERLDAVHDHVDEIGRQREALEAVHRHWSGQRVFGQLRQPGERLRLVGLPLTGERRDIGVIGRLQGDVPDIGRRPLQAETPASFDVELVDERGPEVAIGNRRRVNELLARQVGRS